MSEVLKSNKVVVGSIELLSTDETYNALNFSNMYISKVDDNGEMQEASEDLSKAFQFEQGSELLSKTIEVLKDFIGSQKGLSYGESVGMFFRPVDSRGNLVEKVSLTKKQKENLGF